MTTTAGRTLRLPKLRPLQGDLYRAMRRWNVWICHRRFGKTVLCLNILLKKSFDNPLPAPRYAYLAPLFRQAKQISWDYLKRFASQIPGALTNEAELRLDLPWNGARIQLLGADNPDNLRGMYLDGVVLDEFAQMMPRAWTQVVRPALSDREGWAIKIGTPYGKNHLYFDYREALAETDPAYHAALYKASDTGIISPEELASARKTMRATYGELMGDADYEQEYECAFEAAIPGAYYSAEFAQVDRERRITPCAYDPSYPVYTFWDLGIGAEDATTIWIAQFYGRQIGLLHYYENTGYGAPHYAEYLMELPYAGAYRAHLLPHDGHNRDWGSGERRETALERLVRGQVHIVQRSAVETGIGNVRTLFPRLLFDPSCEKGIEAARHYHRKWDEQKKVFLSHPHHDWSSHGADALRTLANGLEQVAQIEEEFRLREHPPEPALPQLYFPGQASTAWMGR